jgi:hypothetical protein
MAEICTYCWTGTIEGDNDWCASCTKKMDEMTCQGCKEKQPNQMAHMGCGGCLETADDRADREMALYEELTRLRATYEVMVKQRDRLEGEERAKHVEEMEKISNRITEILKELC